MNHAAYAPVAELDRQALRSEVATEEGFAVWREWGSGPALVMLHGGAGSWTHFCRQIRFFARNYRVIVPDLPGFGDSADSNRDADPHRMARILAAGIDQLIGHDRLYLVGFSYGGIIGSFLSKLITPRVKGFAIVGGVGFEARRNEVALSSWRRISDTGQRRARHRDNLLAIMIADPARIDATAILIQQANAERSRHDTRPTARTRPLTANLDAIRIPLAAIWGERDQLAAPYFEERRAWLAERDPEACFKLIEDAGHWVQYEAADAFNDALTDCLRSFVERAET
ncbi:alpha/beta fold hydrolase [Hoeflea halophila]|uniref:alpha/beta fold hydrolase n=1 Tax=Hoeflea halophila TaxID=714899 RepID=UPI000C7B641E|nr:alpha/beta hydrolase [Hoeflea halophila]